MKITYLEYLLICKYIRTYKRLLFKSIFKNHILNGYISLYIKTIENADLNFIILYLIFNVNYVTTNF